MQYASESLQASRPAFFPPCVVGDLLQILGKAVGSICKRWKQQQAASHKSSSKGCKGLPEGQTPESCVESALGDVLRCLSFLALVSVSLPMSAFHRSDGRAWFLPSTAAWSQHTRRLCKLFEGAIRSGAAAVPAGSPAGPMLSMLLSMSAHGAMCLPEPMGVGAHLHAALATQPGRRQQRQLVSLLLTGLKVAARLPAGQYFEAQDVRIAAALGAAAAAAVLQCTGSLQRLLVKSLLCMSSAAAAAATVTATAAAPTAAVQRVAQGCSLQAKHCCHGWCCLAAAACSGHSCCLRSRSRVGWRVVAHTALPAQVHTTLDAWGCEELQTYFCYSSVVCSCSQQFQACCHALRCGP